MRFQLHKTFCIPEFPCDPVVHRVPCTRPPSLVEDVLGLDGAQRLLVTLVGHVVEELLQLTAHEGATSASGRGDMAAGTAVVRSTKLSQESVQLLEDVAR